MTYETNDCVFYGCGESALETLVDVAIYLHGKEIADTSLAVCEKHRAWLLGAIAETAGNGSRYEAGLVREAGEAYNPTAVRWWLIESSNDGFVFARGGREPTEEAANAELASARFRLDVERSAWRARKTHEFLAGSLVRRFSHELMDDGTLRPLVPTDWEIE